MPVGFKSSSKTRPIGVGRALYEEISARITDGTYKAGTALASTRSLADERGLSRATVCLVYEQLAADGFIVTHPGAASRVAHGIYPSSRMRATSNRDSKIAQAPASKVSNLAKRVIGFPTPQVETAPPGTVDFVYGPLSGHDFPTTSWVGALRACERKKSERLSYTDPRGDLTLRQELLAHLSATRGLNCSLDQLMIVNGSQQALDLCARLLIDPGDKVVVENPGYLMAHRAFESYGGKLEFVDVDEHGLKTADLGNILRAQLVYVTPTHQFPLGSFLPLGRRHELLSWAKRSGAWVVEDDYDSEYRYSVRPEATLYSLNEERVIHVGTFSKTLSPQMRLGYMVLPRPLVNVFMETKRLTDRHSSISTQQALALLLHDGTYARHVRKLRRIQQSRQRALVHALQLHLGSKVRVEGAASGLHIVVWFPDIPHNQEPELIAKALKHGVRLYPLAPLYASNPMKEMQPAGAVVGYALLSPAEIADGVAKLAKALAQFSSSPKVQKTIPSTKELIVRTDSPPFGL